MFNWLMSEEPNSMSDLTRFIGSCGMLAIAVVMFYLYFNKTNMLSKANVVLLFALFSLSNAILRIYVIFTGGMPVWVAICNITLSFLVIGNVPNMIRVFKVLYTPNQLNDQLAILEKRIQFLEHAAMAHVELVQVADKVGTLEEDLHAIKTGLCRSNDEQAST